MSTAPLPRLVHVFGAAVDSTGAPQGGVAVAFVPAVAGVGRRVSAVTSSNGFYSVEVPAGDYLGACLSQAGSCQLRTGAGVAHRLTFSGPSMIVSISVTTAVAPSSSPAQEEPAASFSGTAALPDGSPAAGVVIEFKTLCPGVCQQPFVKTDQDGHYAINLDAGTYNALCVVSNEDYECGPRGGDGGPHPVDVPPQGQHLDFVVCLNDQYPACLAS